MHELTLRDYQTKLVSDIREAWQRERSVLAWLPTGGGKTEISVALAMEETCTLFAVDRRTLVGQARTLFGRDPL